MQTESLAVHCNKLYVQSLKTDRRLDGTGQLHEERGTCLYYGIMVYQHFKLASRIKTMTAIIVRIVESTCPGIRPQL